MSPAPALAAAEPHRCADPPGTWRRGWIFPRAATGAEPAAPAACAVVCHPHPLFGGTLTNKVVHTLAPDLQ